MKHPGTLFLLFGSLFASGTTLAQSVPPATALQLANYAVFSGDVNGDGFRDILLKAKPRLVLIQLDDLSVPIPVYPVPTFVLLSNGGSYTLVTSPALDIVNSSVWQANTYTISFGDFIGNGVTSMMIRSTTGGGDTFTVTTPANAVQPTLLQRITPGDLGIDLGDPSRTVEFRDSNRDGRSDLVVRTNGRVTDVFVADSTGQFMRQAGSTGSISVAWNGLRASLDASDAASAVGFFSADTQSRYDSVFQRLGAGELPNISARWSNFQQISVDATYATYAITQTYNGVSSDYLVSFVFENGRWVLNEM